MANPDIAHRAYEEFNRVCANKAYAEMRYGINRSNVYDWKKGNSPNAEKLAALCNMGCDVVYILTGRKSDG